MAYPAEWPKPQVIEMVRDLGGTLMSADYEELERAFPDLNAVDDQKKVDDWLDQKMSYLRKGQIGQLEMNTEIPFDQSTGSLNSATQYKLGLRSVTLRFESKNSENEPTIELKGSGTDKPTPKLNGLLSFAVAEKEFIIEKLIARIAHYVNLDIKTVSHLAVSVSSYKIRKENGRLELAGKLMRKPHVRRSTKRDGLHPDRAKALEHLFRFFGLTAAMELENTPEYLAINVQGDADNALFDFGHYQVRDEFQNEKYIIVGVPEGGFEGIPPKEQKFMPRAPEELKIPIESSFSFEPDTFTKNGDKLYAAINFIIKKHRNGHGHDLAAMRDDLNQFTENLLINFDQKLAHLPFNEWVARHQNDAYVAASLATVHEYIGPALPSEQRKPKAWRRPQTSIDSRASLALKRIFAQAKASIKCRLWLGQ